MKFKKTCFCIFFVCLLMFSFNMCFGINVVDFKPNSESDINFIFGKFGKFLGYMQWIGIVVAVAYLMIMGIKFMQGSIEDKAEIKKNMMPWFIGIVIILTITTLLNVIANIARTL